MTRKWTRLLPPNRADLRLFFTVITILFERGTFRSTSESGRRNRNFSSSAFVDLQNCRTGRVQSRTLRYSELPQSPFLTPSPTSRTSGFTSGSLQTEISGETHLSRADQRVRQDRHCGFRPRAQGSEC